jgi:hypothetical protein
LKACVLYFLALFLLSNLSPHAQQNVSFKRFKSNPIITPEMLHGSDGDDINGPSLIKVPGWVTGKLGKYYLYFAHHKGKYIRLAYANNIKGPWKIYEPGTLQITDCKTCEYGLLNSGNSVKHEGAESAEDEVIHVASPDVLIDSTNQEIVLYFHCPIENGNYKGQYSLRATSKDGIHFKADSIVLGYAYFRVFKWHDNYYSISRAGLFARSKDGIHAFEKGPNPFSKIQNKDNYLRHAAVKLAADTLLVFYSRVGDTPEKIVLSKIILSNDWNTWVASQPVDIAVPALDYEGVNAPLIASKAGLYYGKARQLRDPYVFEDAGKLYLLYSVAGENGIAIGELKFKW